jgi:transposase InsO family protein
MAQRMLDSKIVPDRRYKIASSHKQAKQRKRLNRLGHCTDNTHMESFFHSLQAELIRASQYRNINELRQALMGDINQYFNS